MVKMILIVGVAAAVIAITAVYAYFGGFYKVKFSVIEQGGELLAYREVTGDYKLSGSIMDFVYFALLKDYKIKTYKGFGIYYDNPLKVEKDKLRSDIGCVIENTDSSKVASVEKKFKIKLCPIKKYLVAEFPYRGGMSVIFGIMKVYPALNQYIAANNYSEVGAVMEIYDRPGNKIVYRKEIILGGQ